MKPRRWVDPAKFWRQVLLTESCWLWQGPMRPNGYGYNAPHRRAYELAVGPIPAALTIDHLCRVRHCVNPAHLEAVTNAENLRRQGKASATHCKNGHEFTEANTYRTPWRGCRTCRNAASNAYKARRRAA